MKALTPCLGILAAALLPCSAQVVINEIDADTPGTDTAEFVELFDGGSGNTPLDGYVLVFFNGSNDSSYAAFDLDGFQTSAEGFFVVGNPGVPNVELTFDPGPFGFLQNGADAVALYLGEAVDFPNETAVTTANLVDAVVYDTDDANDAGLLTGLGKAVQHNENENGDKDNQSISRIPDGGATIITATPSPGAPNPVPGGALTLSLDVTTMPEDGSVAINGTVTLPAPAAADVTVTVALDDASEASTFDAAVFSGETEGFFIITAVDDFWPDGDQTVTVTVSATTYTDASETFTVTDDDTSFLVVINEVYNSVDGVRSDANGDGVADTDDEFIEIVNVSGGPLDLSGATLSDASFERHIFPAGTILEDGCALLVFAGGDISEGSTGSFGNTPVQIAISEPDFPGLRLTDSGDRVTLIDSIGSLTGSFGAEVHSVTLPDQSAGANASSITTATDTDATSGYVPHTTTPGGLPYSPGTNPDGTAYCALDDVLTVTITGGPFTETDGIVPGAGSVSVPVAAEADLLVYLDSSDSGELDLGLVSPITIFAGQTSATFDLNLVDDVIVDGTQVVTITARAIGYLNGQTTVDVEDAGDTPAFTDLVINEIDADQAGIDTAEFIELYNNSASPQSLTGLIIALFNGNGDVSYNVIDLAGRTIPANGFFVIGSANVPNVDLPAFTTNGLQNGPDAVALIAGSAADFPTGTPATSITGTIVDALVYSGTDAGLQAALDPTGSSVGGDGSDNSLARVPDGGAALSSGSFVAQAPTPGATNEITSGGDFASWAAANGIPGEPFDGDFDGDGISNGVEYSIAGLVPTAADSLADAFDGTTLSFTKRPEAVANGDVLYLIEESTDLGLADDWSEVSGAGYTNDGTTISYLLPTGATRTFTRLRVLQPVVAP